MTYGSESECAITTAIIMEAYSQTGVNERGENERKSESDSSMKTIS